MNPLDISEMRSEAEELSIKGGIVDRNSAVFSNSLDDFRISDSISSIDIRGLIPKKQPKVDSKGRLYGKVVVCEKCGAKNMTLYDINGKKLCKNCKKGEQ